MVLAIDVGATNTKAAIVDREGRRVGAVRRRLTPYPCTPEAVLEMVLARVARSAPRRVAVGVPVELRGGRVVDPGNLARLHRSDTVRDAALLARWQGVDLEAALRDRTDHDVRVVNDARLALLGCVRGEGRELVVTLGTGCGLGLSVDGLPVEVRDLGEAPFDGERTFDEALGEAGRFGDSDRWTGDVATALRALAREFDVSLIHVAGGNARRLSPSRVQPPECPIRIEGNDASLRGAVRLFETL